MVGCSRIGIKSLEPPTEPILCSITSTGMSRSRSGKLDLVKIRIRKSLLRTAVVPSLAGSTPCGRARHIPMRAEQHVSGRVWSLCCREHTLVVRSKSAVCHWRSTCINVICAAGCVLRSIATHDCVISDVVTWTRDCILRHSRRYGVC
jgi:hypothetical protein